MTFEIRSTVRSRRTGFEYEVVGHDETTLDGREVVLVRPSANANPAALWPVLVEDLYLVSAPHAPSPSIIVEGQEFVRTAQTTFKGKIEKEDFFAADKSGVHVTIDYRHTARGHK